MNESVMIEQSQCDKCGTPLPTGATSAECPNCLLGLGLASVQVLSVADDSPTHVSAEAAPSAHAAVRSFGDYEVLEEIARGGMGVVYKARQKSLNRFVAIKMILAGQFAGKQMTQRFRGEAAAAGTLQHPNIVAIHEIGMHEGRHFFTMDYVEGQNLSQLVGTRPLPLKHAARYVKLLAEAIHYAHQQGILHRDLKPSNVLVDASDQPRITDFGLAKRFDDSQPSTINPQLTLTGQMLGSPNFMPPEQASSQRGKVGRHSDVYGMGAILYHLRTARPPFQAESFESVIAQLLNNEPMSPRLLNSSVPPDLETICVKCLQKEPSRRYQSAQELADELGRFLGGKPIHARPVSRVERAWRWCGRNRPLALTGAVVIILLVTLAIGSPIAAFRINRERLRAEVARQNETQLRQQAQAQELVSRQNSYAADISATFYALDQGNLGLARRLLT